VQRVLAKHAPAAQPVGASLGDRACTVWVLVLAVVIGVFEYRAWQTTEELAQLDELSIASMLVL
jgi:hypothetical protein